MPPPAATTTRRLVSNTGWNMGALIVNALVGFLLIRFFLGHLGPAKFGLWVLIGSIFRYRGVFSMGLNTAVNRFVPQYYAQADHEGLQRVVGTAMQFYTLMAVLCLALSFLFYHYVGDWFKIDPALIPEAKHMVLIVGIGFSLVLPLQLGTAVLAGLQRYDLISGSVLLTLVIRTILLVVMLNQGFGLLTMAFLFAGSEVVVRLVQWASARRLLGGIRFSGRGGDWTFMGEMLACGINSFLYATGAVVMIKACDLVIGVSPLSLEHVTQFSLAAAAVLLLTQIVQSFTRAVMPAVSDLHARDDQAHVQEMALLAQKYSLFIILPAVVFLVVMGRAFLTIWVGDRIGDPVAIHTMASVLSLLAIGHGCRLTQHSNFLVLVGCGEHWFFGCLTAVTTIVIVLGSVFVLFIGGGELTALAWANCIPLLLSCGIVLPLHFNRHIGISWSRSAKTVWCPVLLSVLPALLVMGGWRAIAEPRDWWQLIAALMTVVMVTVGGAVYLGLDASERKRFGRLLGLKKV